MVFDDGAFGNVRRIQEQQYGNRLIAPGLTLRQYAHDVALLGDAYSHIPPYMLGFNPYPQYLMSGPMYTGTSPLASYYSMYPTFGYGLYTPYSFLPYGY